MSKKLMQYNPYIGYSYIANIRCLKMNIKGYKTNIRRLKTNIKGYKTHI